jgi:hypothetical protein
MVRRFPGRSRRNEILGGLTDDTSVASVKAGRLSALGRRRGDYYRFAPGTESMHAAAVSLSVAVVPMLPGKARTMDRERHHGRRRCGSDKAADFKLPPAHQEEGGVDCCWHRGRSIEAVP